MSDLKSSKELLGEVRKNALKVTASDIDKMREEYKNFPLRAFGNRVITAMIDVEMYTKTDSGIQLKNENLGVESKGLVISVGEGVSGIKVGDVVHHGYHAGHVFGFGSENFKSLNDYEILAIEEI